MKIRRLKKRNDYIQALIQYHKSYYTDGGFPSIFSLQKEMLKIGICPRCGKPSRRWSSSNGHFPCWECGFNITENEINKVSDDEYPQKYILKKRLRQKAKEW
jgi:predicted amidophosphoribosyltransferase